MRVGEVALFMLEVCMVVWSLVGLPAAGFWVGVFDYVMVGFGNSLLLVGGCCLLFKFCCLFFEFV